VKNGVSARPASVVKRLCRSTRIQTPSGLSGRADLARAPPWQNRDKTPSVGHLCVKTRPALVRLETPGPATQDQGQGSQFGHCGGDL